MIHFHDTSAAGKFTQTESRLKVTGCWSYRLLVAEFLFGEMKRIWNQRAVRVA